jgi:pimeloyl-ACP methyl ester carboxylesterase
MADSWTHHTYEGERFPHVLYCRRLRVPLFFLHGWPQTSYEWRKILQSVAERFTIIAPDLRGLGLPCEKPPEQPLGFSQSLFMADTHALIQLV